MSNYGEAGAIDRYGPKLGLPRAYSGHNGYWCFGRPPGHGRPPDTGGPTIVVGPDTVADASNLRQYWTDVRPVGRIDNRVGLDDEEQGKPGRSRRGHPAGPDDHVGARRLSAGPGHRNAGSPLKAVRRPPL